MKILSALRKKKVERDFYLSLLLKPHKAAAILFEKTQNSLVIISTKEVALESDLDSLSSDELVQIMDTVTSSVEGALPENESVEKTIFSIPHSWQVDGKISQENLTKLKKICDSLELKAIGFIVSVEAVVKFMQKKDGVPVKAIFVEHTSNQVFVYIVENSNILQIQASEVGEDFVKTVEDLLETADIDSLPAKIILHDYEGAESLQQEFLNHEWKSELNFLHVPQVLVLDKGFENEAVINGVASQMGFEVLQDIKAGAEIDEDGFIKEEEVSDIELATAEEFGFSSGEGLPKEDVVSEDKEDKVESLSEEDSENTESNVSLEESLHDNLREPKINEPLVKDKDEEKEQEDLPAEKDSKTSPLPIDNRVTLVDKLKELPPVVFLSSLLKGGGKSILAKGLNLKFGLIVLAFILVLSFISYAYYNWYLKTDIVIFSDSQVVQTEEEVILVEDSNTSYSQKLINLATVTETVDISAQQKATGKKETGEKASGEVTIYNKTERPVTLEKGTVVSSNDLDFVTLSEIKIASTSSFATDFSSQKVKVEASKFGKEYNLPSNSNFTVAGRSTANLIAKNSTAFAGGSTKELTVISANDIEGLRKETENGSLDKALSAVKSKVNGDAVLIDSPISVKLNDEKISGKEGQEAESVSLTGKLVYTFGTYTRNDVTEFVHQLAKSEVPDGYVFLEDQSEIRLLDIKTDGDDVTAKLSVDAVFAPNIEISKLLGEIRGKNFENAEKSIEQVKGVSDVTVVSRNKLPLFPSFLPFNANNIKITLKTDG